jgi:hypothetical protein
MITRRILLAAVAATPLLAGSAWAEGLISIIVTDPANPYTWGTVWLVMYRTSETVNVANGDNAGLALTYTHVVVEMDRKDMWRGQALSFELPLMELTEAHADGCVVIIQQERDGMPGPIIGAIAYPLTGW